MKEKYLIAVFSSILSLMIITTNIIDNNLSNINNEKANSLLNVNLILLDSHDKAFYAVGSEIDALGFLIEKRVDEYKSKISESKKSKLLFDNLYNNAKYELGKLKEKEGKIIVMQFWGSLLKTVSVFLAISILILSLFYKGIGSVS